MSSMLLNTLLTLLIQGASKLDPPPPPDFKTAVDYAAWFERQVVRGQSKDDNAQSLYAGIFGSLSVDPIPPIGFDGPRTGENPKETMEPWDPKQHPDWEAAYQKTKDKIEQFKRAAAKPYAWWGIRLGDDALPKFLMYCIMNELSLMRSLAKGTSENAWRAPGGKIDESAFVAAQRAILGMARQLDRNPAVISQLVGYSVRSMAYDDLLRAAELGVLSDKQRASVLLMLAGRDDPPAPFANPITAEMAFAFDVIQHIAMKNDGKYGFVRQSGLITLDRTLSTDAAKARDAMKTLLETLAKESNAAYSSELLERMKAAKDQARAADPLCVPLIVDFDRTYLVRTRCEAKRRATRLVYEILVYQDKHKKWPASLNDLPPEVSKMAKSDPFSDQPFMYRVQDGKPLLYSVAQNSKDDGGTKHDPKWGDDVQDADYIIWPRQ